MPNPIPPLLVCCLLALSSMPGTPLMAAREKTATKPKDARAALIADIQHSVQEYPGLAETPNFRAALAAIASIDRAAFVPAEQRQDAYRDTPLSIGFDQTISDPYIVAIMTAAVAVQPGSNVLEIGTGSGYQAAVLSRIGAKVHSIEIVQPLAAAADAHLRKLGFPNVTIRAGDGFAGWPEAGPFDAIIVTAGARDIPAPLIAQMRPGGKLVMPIGPVDALEQLVLVTRASDGLKKCSLGPASFVPLTGQGRSPSQGGLYDRSIPLCYKGQTARWPGQPIGK